MRKYQCSQTVQQRTVPLSQTWSVLLNWILPCVTLVPGQRAVWVRLGCSLMAILFASYLSGALPGSQLWKYFRFHLSPGHCKVGNLLLFWVPHFDYVVLSLLLVLEWPLAVDIIKVTAHYSWHHKTLLCWKTSHGPTGERWAPAVSLSH